jgi:hypothetical protein
MSNDKFQDKYDEIFQNLKEEKMNWDFDDFLKSRQKNESLKETCTCYPIDTKTKPSFPKWFWMAASVMLVLVLDFP